MLRLHLPPNLVAAAARDAVFDVAEDYTRLKELVEKVVPITSNPAYGAFMEAASRDWRDQDNVLEALSPAVAPMTKLLAEANAEKCSPELAVAVVILPPC